MFLWLTHAPPPTSNGIVNVCFCNLVNLYILECGLCRPFDVSRFSPNNMHRDYINRNAINPNGLVGLKLDNFVTSNKILLFWQIIAIIFYYNFSFLAHTICPKFAVIYFVCL